MLYCCVSGYWLFRFFPTGGDDDAKSLPSDTCTKAVERSIFSSFVHFRRLLRLIFTFWLYTAFITRLIVVALPIFHCEGSGWIRRFQNSGSFPLPEYLNVCCCQLRTGTIIVRPRRNENTHTSHPPNCHSTATTHTATIIAIVNIGLRLVLAKGLERTTLTRWACSQQTPRQSTCVLCVRCIQRKYFTPLITKTPSNDCFIFTPTEHAVRVFTTTLRVQKQQHKHEKKITTKQLCFRSNPLRTALRSTLEWRIADYYWLSMQRNTLIH